MELDKRGAELLFQGLTEREEKTAVAVASNDSFSGWDQDLHRPTGCAPGNIIETGTSCYGLAHAGAHSGRNDRPQAIRRLWDGYDEQCKQLCPRDGG